MKSSLNLFKYFCSKNKVDGEKLSKSELSNLLSKFWPSVRLVKGESYKKYSLLILRFGISKYLKQSHKIDITENELTWSNKVHHVIAKLKRRGYGKTATTTYGHKNLLSKEDIDKLYMHRAAFSTQKFNRSSKQRLFEIMLYFCWRGKENSRDHKKDTFTVKVDCTGRKYVCQRIG